MIKGLRYSPNPRTEEVSQCDMERALYDLAEAACGQNSAMRWSLSETILRRQVGPVFDKCADGSLPPESALDVAMDFVTAGVQQNAETLEVLFNRLAERVQEMLPGVEIAGMSQLQEFVLGLNVDAEWATNDGITRREMYPMFVRLSVGKIEASDGVTIFCNTIHAKRDFYLELIQQLTTKITQEIVLASSEEATDGE